MRCWYSGVYMTNPNSSLGLHIGLSARTKEHIISRSCDLYKTLNLIQHRKNIVEVCSFMNGVVGNMPVGFKLIVKDFAQEHFARRGTYELTKRDMRTISSHVKTLRRDFLFGRDPKLVSKIFRLEREFLLTHFKITEGTSWDDYNRNRRAAA